MKLILPKTLPHSLSLDLPLFFLAGPIHGGDDWQAAMAEMLTKLTGDCIIVNPSRYTEEHPLYQYRVAGREDVYPRQTDWEHHYLRYAADKWPIGCIIFWLPEESKTNPRTGPKPYAMDTRGEIGVWRGHLAHDRSLRIAIGAEPGFPGLSTIERNFLLDIGPGFKIHSTMEDVADEAMTFVRRGLPV